jgi:hypothetical protein
VRSFPAGKRGPKTVLSDAELLELIRADLKASPFQRDGYRKVSARRQCGPLAGAQAHAEDNLLSPTGAAALPSHSLMWGTKGAKVFIMEEGRG